MPTRLRLTVLTTLLLVFHMSSRSAHPEGRSTIGDADETANVVSWDLASFAIDAMDQYGFPLGQLFITFLYGVYRRLTLLNMTVFLLKYIPTGLYMYKMLKNFHTTCRERLRQKEIELEDIQLQIQIINTKLCVREAEYSERSAQLRRGIERLRVVRTRVRDMINADEVLRRAQECAAPWGDEPEIHVHSTPEEDHDFIKLLKELKSDQLAIPERLSDKMECGEHMPSEEVPSTEHSVYSSLSDGDLKHDCRIKIIKVTNVYKVAYLKHFIKQKRLRRATQQAVLKKKIESIKKLLEGWQKSLNSVINSKILRDTQEAMGDYSKGNMRESSDSDSDLKTSVTDNYNEEYSLSWTQNPYKSYGYAFDDTPDPAIAQELYGTPEFTNDYRYSTHVCECNEPKGLFILPEETVSQIAIEEIRNNAGEECDTECRDVIAI